MILPLWNKLHKDQILEYSYLVIQKKWQDPAQANLVQLEIDWMVSLPQLFVSLALLYVFEVHFLPLPMFFFQIYRPVLLDQIVFQEDLLLLLVPLRKMLLKYVVFF